MVGSEGGLGEVYYPFVCVIGGCIGVIRVDAGRVGHGWKVVGSVAGRSGGAG